MGQIRAFFRSDFSAFGAPAPTIPDSQCLPRCPAVVKDALVAMDPAAYARYRGIQSEVNKVTVTRVAYREIEYRRAVENYR